VTVPLEDMLGTGSLWI